MEQKNHTMDPTTPETFKHETFQILNQDGLSLTQQFICTLKSFS